MGRLVLVLHLDGRKACGPLLKSDGAYERNDLTDVLVELMTMRMKRRKRAFGMNSSHYSHFIAVTVQGEQNSVILLKIHPQGKFCT